MPGGEATERKPATAGAHTHPVSAGFGLSFSRIYCIGGPHAAHLDGRLRKDGPAMDLFGFILGATGFWTAVMAMGQVNALKKEVEKLATEVRERGDGREASA